MNRPRPLHNFDKKCTVSIASLWKVGGSTSGFSVIPTIILLIFYFKLSLKVTTDDDLYSISIN
jgi:hypothetical protein